MNSYRIFVCLILFYSRCTLGLWFYPFWNDHLDIDIPTCIPSENLKQENFNLTQFSGRWYETHGLNNHNQVFVNGPVIIFLIKDKTLIAEIPQVVDFDDELIIPHPWQLIYSNQQFILHKSSTEDDRSQTSISLVETDYVNYAILYACSSPKSSSQCDENFQFLSVLSRSPSLGRTLRSYVANLVKTKLCINLDNVFSKHESKIQAEEESLTESSSCIISDIQHQKNFNFKKFSGVWFNLAQSRIEESGHLDGAVSKYILSGGKSLSITYFGNVRGQCIPPLHVNGELLADNVPEFKMNYEIKDIQYSERMKILYTDYKDSAILYVCYKENRNGTCAKNSTFIDFLSRYPTFSKKTREKLNNILSHFCIQPEEVINANYSVNCFPPVVEKTLEKKKAAKTEGKIRESKNTVPVRLIKEEDKKWIRNSKAYLSIKKNSMPDTFDVKAIGIAPEVKAPDETIFKDIEKIEDKVLFDDNANSQKIKKDKKEESDSSDDDNSEEKQKPEAPQEIDNDEETTTIKGNSYKPKCKNPKESDEDQSGSSSEEKTKNNGEINSETKTNGKRNKKEGNEDESNENKKFQKDDCIEDGSIVNKTDSNEDKSNEDKEENINNKDRSNEDKSIKEKYENNEDEDKDLKKKDESSEESIDSSDEDKIKKKDSSSEEESSEEKKVKKIKKSKVENIKSIKNSNEKHINPNGKDEITANNKNQLRKWKKQFVKNMKERKQKDDLFQKYQKANYEDNRPEDMDTWNDGGNTDWFLMRDRESVFDQNNRYCLEHYQLARKLQRKYPSWNIFHPRCDYEGQYQTIQCNNYKECWCVSPDGITIAGTRRHVRKIENVAITCDDLKKV